MPLSLKFALRGTLKEALRAEYRTLERSVKAAIHENGQNLKGKLRQDTTRAGLGPRVGNAWRARTYPTGSASAGAAAVVWSKAPKIILNFELAREIRPKNKKFLAIPTEAARRSGFTGPGGTGKSFVRGTRQQFTVGRAGATRSRSARLSPSNFPAGKLGKLRFIPTKKGGVLVLDKAVKTFSRKTGDQSGFRRAGPKSRSQGGSVIMFVLVRNVRPRKKLNVQRLAELQVLSLARDVTNNYKNAPLTRERVAGVA